MAAAYSHEVSRRALLMGASAAVAGIAGIELFAVKSATVPSPPVVVQRSTPHVANPNWFAFAHDRTERLLVLTGSDGVVLRSANAGLSFEVASTDVAEPLFGVCIEQVTGTIVAVGGNGCVLVSTDGGRSFARKESGTSSHLRHVASARAGTTVAVGDQGAVLVSSDGGNRFQVERAPTDANLGFIRELPGDAGFIVAGEHGTVLHGEPGKGWKRIPLDVDATITCLTVTKAGTLIVGTDAPTVFRSTDSTSFEPVSTGEFVTSIAASPDAKVVLATTRDGGIMRSIDGGATFVRVDVHADTYLSQAKFNASTRSFLVVGNRGTALKSSRDGKGFEPIQLNAVEDLQAVDALEPSGRALLAGRGGLLASVEAEAKKARTLTAGIPEYMHAALCDTRGGNLIAVGVEGTCVRSTDGGSSWSRVELSSPETSTLYAVTQHPSSGAILIGGSGGLLLRSSDGGAQFTQIQATSQSIGQLYVHGERVLALALDEGVLYSDDGGATFRRAALEGPASLLAVAPAGKDALVAVGMQGVICRSTDSGASWRRIHTGTSAELRALLRHPVTGDVWIVGTQGTVLCSTDGAAQFSTIDAGTQTNLSAISFHRASGALLVAGTKGTLLELVEGERRFEAVDTSTSEKLRLLLEDPLSSDLLVAGSGGLVLRGRNARSLRPVFTHTTAAFASAVHHGPSGSWIFVGERLLRLPMGRG